MSILLDKHPNLWYPGTLVVLPLPAPPCNADRLVVWGDASRRLCRGGAGFLLLPNVPPQGTPGIQKMGRSSRNYYREAWEMHLKLLGRIFRRRPNPSPQATRRRPVEDTSNRNVEEMEQQSSWRSP